MRLKLASFETYTSFGTAKRIGVLLPSDANKMIDLQSGYAMYLKEVEGEERASETAAVRVPSDMIAFLDRGETGWRIIKTTVAYVEEAMKAGNEINSGESTIIFHLNEVKLKAPITFPRMIMDFVSFEQHMKLTLHNVPKTWYEMPVCYKKNPGSTVGPNEPIVWPNYTEKLDYELELAIIIKKKGKNIPREEAYEYIAGYTVFNDFSARDILSKEMELMLGPFKGKDFDSAAAMGPFLTTHEEIKDPHNLKMTAKVNGETWSEANTRDMYWKIPQLIEYVSKEETVYPGYILGSGTPGGGCGLELGKWIKPGDVIELEIQGIGVLRNKIVRPIR